jgi:GT2 family glycosyltransferase
VRRTATARLVQETTNRGIAGGFNDGVAALSHASEYLILMSADALVVDPDLLNVLHQSFEASRNVGCLHPLSFFEDAPEKCNYSSAFDSSGFRSMRASDPELALERETRLQEQVDAMLRRVRGHRRWVSAPVSTLPLTFFCVRSEVFAALEGFDEGFVCGHENNDFVLRARRKGWTARVARRTLVLHRRMLFRSLGQAGNTEDSIYREMRSDSAAHWREKYGEATARQLFREAQWGTVIGKHVIPLADPARRALGLGPLLRNMIGRFDRGNR